MINITPADLDVGMGLRMLRHDELEAVSGGDIPIKSTVHADRRIVLFLVPPTEIVAK